MKERDRAAAHHAKWGLRGAMLNRVMGGIAHHLVRGVIFETNLIRMPSASVAKYRELLQSSKR
jgi:hypothetical protein